MTKCDKCGEEYEIGAWPWCPHEQSRYRVDAFEGYWDENLGSDPIWITSAAQRRKIMDREGLEYKDKFREARKGGGGLFFDMKAR